MPPGSFGENLTVDGLPDSDVCVGDRFRIGGGVFEVTQPRVTCYRLGIRMNRPDMPSLVVGHGRPGFYLRVIEEGEVCAGDVIEKVADGPEHISVAAISALLYSPDHPADDLRRALRIPALSPGWQGSMRALLDAAERGDGRGNAGLVAAPPPALAWRGFRPLEVMAVKDETADVRSFELASTDDTPLPDARPGQHIVLRLRPSADAIVTRIYSLCGPPRSGTYQIGVKREGGAGSAFLHDRVRVGDRLDVSAPRGTFTLAAGEAPIVLLSAGIGVTPLLGMLQAIAATGATREVWWIHSARDGAHHAFADRTGTLMATLSRGHVFRAYSQPGAGDELGRHYDVRGRISIGLLRERGLPRDADFYLCGPQAYLEGVQADLKAWGVEPSQVHVEVFAPAPPLMPGVVSGGSGPPHVPSGPQGPGPLVTFARSSLSVRWSDRYASLLELAEACSVPVRWSCRTGVCHNCESGLIDGAVRYATDPLDPPPDGVVLICSSAPATDVALDL